MSEQVQQSVSRDLERGAEQRNGSSGRPPPSPTTTAKRVPSPQGKTDPVAVAVGLMIEAVLCAGAMVTGAALRTQTPAARRRPVGHS